ncbi:MAG TPA: hypothetical protein VFA25_05735 [Actinomycetota bacterium]|jgi:hypothetical protein|nr:hypothetical protein [Actinomycetota bacterium]
MRRLSSLLVLVMLVGAGCSLPARDLGDYRFKATEAADETISEAETAVLAGDLWLRGRLFGNSVAVQLEDAEQAAEDAVDGFASVLPPDHRSEALRADLVPLLDETADLISRLRFAVRHDDVTRFRDLHRALRESSRRLETWAARHG